MSNDELQTIRQAYEDANACTGNDEWFANENDLLGGWCVGTSQVQPSVDREGSDVADLCSEAVARFIATAYRSIPALLSEVQRLQENDAAYQVRLIPSDSPTGNRIVIDGKDYPVESVDVKQRWLSKDEITERITWHRLSLSEDQIKDLLK